MNKASLAAAILALTAACGGLIAAEPQLWVWGRARGAAKTDPRFDQVVMHNLKFGAVYSAIDPATGTSLMVDRSGSAVGARMAKEAIARGRVYGSATPDPSLALLFISFAQRGVEDSRDPSGFITYNEYPGAYPDNPLTFPSLYADAGDAVTYTVGTTSYTKRGPWLKNGMAGTRLWMADFLSAYNSTVYSGSHAAVPIRILLDQEVPFILNWNQWDHVYQYWLAISNDTRFTDPTWPVPGGTETLASLWGNAGSPVPDATASNDPTLIGGSPANHAWFMWWLSVENRAMGGAISDTVGQQMLPVWPDTRIADYDATLRSHGVAPKNYLGLYGQSGFSYPVAQNMNGCLNNLHSYSDSAAWLWSYFRVKTELVGPPVTYTTGDRWKNTDDRGTPMYGVAANGFGSPRVGTDFWAQAGDEFWEESSLRVNRFNLDGCLRRNAGAVIGADPSPAITSWITLPTQPFYFLGKNKNDTALRYDGIDYANDLIPVRQSVYAIYRTLAACRTRGVNEFMVWSDSGADADTANGDPLGYNGEGQYNLGIHPDYASNWNSLRRAVNLVYDYDVSSATASSGTMTVPAGSTAVACLRLADSGIPGENLASRAVTVTSATGGAATLDVTFQHTRLSEAAPQFLNFEFELSSGFGGFPPGGMTMPNYSLSFYNYQTSSYQAINSASTVKDQDAHLWSGANAKATFNSRTRLRARIPFNAARLNASNQCTVRLSLSGTAGYTQYLYVDNIICYGSDDNRRLRGDLNGDGSYTTADTNLFNLFCNPGAIPIARLGYRQLADFNNDGLWNAADTTLWNQITAGATSPFDDYRQAGNDPRTPPARTIP